jgi:hypothetical protein
MSRRSGGVIDVLRLVIPDWVPDMGLSLNGRRRASPWDIRAWQQAAHERVTIALWQAPWHPRGRSQMPRFVYARVAVEFVFPVRRRRDPDNLAGLVKPCLDTLVTEGLLMDDDCDHLELSIRAVVEKGKTETRICIEGAPGGRGAGREPDAIAGD